MEKLPVLHPCRDYRMTSTETLKTLPSHHVLRTSCSAVSLCVCAGVSLCSLSLGLVEFLDGVSFRVFPNPGVFSKHFLNYFCLKIHVLSLNQCLIPQILGALPAALLCGLGPSIWNVLAPLSLSYLSFCYGACLRTFYFVQYSPPSTPELKAPVSNFRCH